MPRDAAKVRRSLQQAALKLFKIRGYEGVTAADIAAEAGVTQRTFFRHFPDKREVLFDGEEFFIEALKQAVAAAPTELGAWQTLRYALRAVEPVFIKNREFAAPRQRLIASHPALQERAQTKLRDVMASLTQALRMRGMTDRSASLASQMGMAAMNQAVAAWLADEGSDLGDHIDEAFQDVADLLGGTTTPALS